MALALGQPAPDFSLSDQHGQQVTVGQFLGRNLLMVFYPFAFSSVCSGELLELRDSLDVLVTDSSALVAVSCDSMFTLRTLADQDRLSFPLLSDFWPHGATARAYDVFDERSGSATRSTIVIDREGLIRWQVDNELGAARDLDVYQKVLTELA